MAVREMPVKLCRDCKWARIGFWNSFWFPFDRYSFARCTHAQAVRQGAGARVYVDGHRDGFFHCTTMRLSDCGPEGKFWESKHIIHR